jgi:hypothetical protein
MIWPFKSKPEKVDPLTSQERQNDDLKQQLRDMRERLLRETVARTVQKDDG